MITRGHWFDSGRRDILLAFFLSLSVVREPQSLLFAPYKLDVLADIFGSICFA